MEPAEYQTMRAAEEYHWWYAGVHDLVLRIVGREAANLKRPLDILDAGCGTGRLCQLLQPFGNVTGCDIHPLALESTAQRGIHRVLRRDLVADGLGSEEFDLITCVDVLYHRAVKDVRTALCNLRCALRQEGLLILHLPAFELLRGAHDLAVHTRLRFRRAETVRLLQSTGFTVEFASYRLFACFLPALLWRTFTRFFVPRACNAHRRSDLTLAASAPMNQLLAAGIRVENRFLTSRVCLPAGTSLFALARRQHHACSSNFQ